MTTIRSLGSKNFTSFTEGDTEIYNTLLENADKMHQLTIRDIAELSYTSRSSVLRFVQKLGFRGFSDFKYSINWDDKPVETKDFTSSLVDEVRKLEQSLTPDKINQFTQLIKEASLICLIATGEDQNIQMKNFGRFLLKKGIISSQLQLNPNSEITKLVLDKLNQDSLLIICSASGNSKLVRKYITPIFENEVKTIAITGFVNSWLAENADLHFSLNLAPRDEHHSLYSSGLTHLMINLLLEKSDL